MNSEVLYEVSQIDNESAPTKGQELNLASSKSNALALFAELDLVYCVLLQLLGKRCCLKAIHTSKKKKKKRKKRRTNLLTPPAPLLYTDTHRGSAANKGK